MPSRPPTYADAILILRLIRLLMSRASLQMRLDELADALECERRTLTRYIDAIGSAVRTDAGQPLVTRKGRGAKACACLALEEKPVSSTLYHYAAMWSASRWWTTGGGSLIGDTAERALATMEQSLADRQRELLTRVPTAFHYIPFGPKDLRASEEVLNTLMKACLWLRPVRVSRARSDGVDVVEQIEPYTLVMYRDGLYVLARFIETDDVRLLAVERVRAVEEVRGETFALPEAYDPEAYFADRLGLWEPESAPERVEVAFSAITARGAASRRWPGQEGWFDLEDGRRVLHLLVPITPEVVTWIVSWGPQAEVLAPPSLRGQVAERLRAAASLYDAPVPGAV